MTRKMKKWCSTACVLPVVLGLSACKSTDESVKSDADGVPMPQGTVVAAIVEGVPGGVFASSVEVNAVVTAVNKSTREVTIKGSDGAELTTLLGPEVINFDQIDVGDRVEATVSEELVIYLGDAQSAGAEGGATLVAGAVPGDKPGMVIADTALITATVVVIDVEDHSATLKFSDGSTETVAVRPDIDLTKYAVGQQVVFQQSYMVTIEVLSP